ARWAELMIQHEITVWHSVPALLEMFVNHISDRADLCPQSLRLVLLGGDWIPVNLPDRLKAMVKGVHMVSMGGATECSMDSTIYDIEAPSSNWKSIPYGVPMANQLAYVLDSRFNPLPIGVPGELYLGGIGVGSGYLNRAQLTAEKFVPNPFSGVPGDRMYRTGDLVRYMLDGNLELLGRIDFQVKVRGYRVELGEIASTLCQHSAVKEALVVANDIEQGTPSKGKQLVAYVVQQLQGNDEGAPSNQSQTEHISQWQQIYAETYSETSDTHDPTFNIIGWNSSYTGLPIPLEEMREWVDQSIQRILALQPTRILELACGTGLLLFKVAPHCEKYVGVDFSNEGLNYIRQQLARPELDMSQVTLLQRMADNFEGIEPDSFDLVILHSVVQLFPGIDYLLRVLEGAINAVQPGGFIFVGDVISLPLLEAFHTSVQLFQAPSWVSKAELRQRVQKAMNKEEQLFLDPAFFTALMQHHPKITQIEIQLRRGRFLNEMTRFRFDVVLHIGGEIEAKKEIQWLDWQEQKMTISAVHKLLTEAEPEIMGIASVPNSRLAAEVTVVELLASSNGPETVEDMRATLDQMTQNGFIDPEDFWAISDKLPYDVSINWSTSVSSFDVLFRHRMAGSANLSRSRPPGPHGKVSIKPWSNYANNPLQSAMARRLVPELRTFLQEKLPDYMAPSTFVLLDALPLSPNGKVDRRALPPPDQTRPEGTADFVSPRNPVEEVVASIWAEVFDFEQVGIHDNFLEMGGHSLLAIQIMSRLLDVFPVELPLRYLFASPNVAELVKRIEEAGNDAGVEVMEIARMLISVAQLSDQKVKSILAGEADDTSILKQL
ncbi:MAG: AMP-binding protein, partial [Verrucomicrobia bacterium]|nr:AMP-binding protein [Verrucomicrobiota bacterium]